MIEVRRIELAEVDTTAILRPVASDWSAVTSATRRLELAAGPELASLCHRLGELPVGSATITPAGNLAAKFMVHVVVRSDDEAVTVGGVRRGLANGLRRLAEWEIDSLALGPLGTGAGNLDAEQAAALMIPLLVEHARAHAMARIEIAVDNEYEQDVFSVVLAQALAEQHAAPPQGGGPGGS